MTVKNIILYVDLAAGEATALRRSADKTGWSEAIAVLYRMLIKRSGAIRARGCHYRKTSQSLRNGRYADRAGGISCANVSVVVPGHRRVHSRNPTKRIYFFVLTTKLTTTMGFESAGVV